ncbi:hypothetical protein F0562_003481 [Nyssa sinensis]|uniref:Amidase domain-containing protein n=1 Tax=Nyssa sinensis TaxID=561372 RepID=A0A5J5BZI2_9ASTE|nr:hypothetical protein F0562_003481 [Nyssa sinensis]
MHSLICLHLNNSEGYEMSTIFRKTIERSKAWFLSLDHVGLFKSLQFRGDNALHGEPISALDGVPTAIKDEIDYLPYPTTGGTKWLHKVRPCMDDACCVKHLRLCGAILVGKTNMHELRAVTSGINPHYGVTKNPYDTGRIFGCASSGSAAVVSAGLCPVALGVDGGGDFSRAAGPQ